MKVPFIPGLIYKLILVIMDMGHFDKTSKYSIYIGNIEETYWKL